MGVISYIVCVCVCVCVHKCSRGSAACVAFPCAYNSRACVCVCVCVCKGLITFGKFPDVTFNTWELPIFAIMAVNSLSLSLSLSLSPAGPRCVDAERLFRLTLLGRVMQSEF